MNRVEHLLACLAEECAEVAQQATKAQRFGLEDFEPGQTLTNRERVQRELNDVLGVAALLGLSVDDHGAIEQKKEKVRKWMTYAEKVGALTVEGEP